MKRHLATSLMSTVSLFASMLCAPFPASAAVSAEPVFRATAPGPNEPRSATVPFTLDHNRMMVDVEFVRPDGTVRPARAWLDTGNEVIILSKPLARDLGIDVSGVTDEAGLTGWGVESCCPVIRIGGMSLATEGVKVQVQPGAFLWNGLPADFNLPASVLKDEHLILDYPALRLTIARPGVREPEGTPIPCRVNAETGLFMLEAIADGDTVCLGIDNGAAGTWVSDSLTSAWTARHPDWPHAVGAAGSANFFGFPFESTGVLMRLPELEIGPLHPKNISLLGLDQSLFDWYSKKSAGPVLGFIGSNVLRNFRIEVYFPTQMTYWTAGPADTSRPTDTPDDLDIVGLTIGTDREGNFIVAGVVSVGGEPAVKDVRPGDRLVSVDGREVADRTMGEVVDSLRGRPGSGRSIVLERDGKRLRVEAKVLRLL